MPPINFQKQFAAKILSGEKRQTIRSRKIPIKVGDRLYLYTGQRTKNCVKLGEADCVVTNDFRLEQSHFEDRPAKIYIDGVQICQSHINELAHRDGFESVDLFIDFFVNSPKAINTGLKTYFLGQIINWRDLDASS